MLLPMPPSKIGFGGWAICSRLAAEPPSSLERARWQEAG